MSHQLRIICPAPVFGVIAYICCCGHRSYTSHDWTTHTQQETP